MSEILETISSDAMAKQELAMSSAKVKMAIARERDD